MIRVPGKLLFMCGKMAAGKSTLARQLIARHDDAVLLVQDDLLGALYPDEFVDFDAFLKFSNRLRTTLAPHVISLLSIGVTVVLDFPANTRRAREWFRGMYEEAAAGHELHFIVASDDLCKRQLRQRSLSLKHPPGAKWTTDEDFEEVTSYFEPPSSDEGYNVIRHERG